MEYDIFICHASEDKQDFVKPLADALVKKNLKVWYDEFELTLGDSLREKIDYGLVNSRYGVVVLSKDFFEKKWPKEELDGLAARQTSEGRKVILPIWHKVSFEDVKQFSPMLAGKLAASSDQGLEAVVAQILDVCVQDFSPKSESVFQTKTTSGLREKCLEIIRSDNILAWRELVEGITEEIIENLRILKQTVEQDVSQMLTVSYNKELHKKHVCEAVNISIPGLVPILTAIQIGKEKYWGESIGFLSRLILLHKNIGLNKILRIEENVLYIAGSIGMALAARTKQLNFIKLWAEMKLPEKDHPGEITWWETSEINCWHTGITGQYDNPYGFIIGLLELDDIKPFFNNGEIFKQFLFSGNLLHSMVEFKNQASQAYFGMYLINQSWYPNVLPVWCLMKPNNFIEETWRIFGSSTEVINFACPGIMPNAEKFWPLWQAWKKKCIAVMADGGRYREHLQNIYSLNLPGEPPIQT